jgi:hypothetical protein
MLKAMQDFENRDFVFLSTFVIMMGVERPTVNPPVSAVPLA